MSLKENLEKIEFLKKQFDQLKPLGKEADNTLWTKFRLEWNFNSNHIEGNTLTYGETRLLLFFGKTTGDHEMREYEEMKAHDVAILAIKEWAEDKTRELTETDIRNLNKIILVRPFWKEAQTQDGQPTRRLIKVGDYKEHPNSVRLPTGEMFDFASPEETQRLMAELLNWYRGNKEENCIELASELHYRFIRIHPFDDGNGRIARLLVNYILMKDGFPPIIIKTADKTAYLTALQKADSGDIEAFGEYISKQLIWSLEIAIKAAKGESIEEQDDVEKEISIFKKKQNKSPEVISKSDKQIYELYQDGIKQFVELYIHKMKQFDDLFTRKEIKGEIQNPKFSAIKFNSFEEIDDYFQNYESISLREMSKKIGSGGTSFKFNTVKLSIDLIGYKNGGEINAFSVTNNITLRFLEFSYDIYHQDQIIISKKYNQVLDIEEANKLVNGCLKVVLSQIKTKQKELQ